MRASYFADAIGYDSSYISRWISGEKLPSLKNNDDLFAKMANVIVRSCSAEDKKVVAGELLPQLTGELSDQKLEAEIARLLSNAFYSSSASPLAGRFMPKSGSANANMAILAPKTVYQIFYNSMEYVARTTDEPYINLIVNAPAHFHANEEFLVIRNVPSGGELSKPIRIHQTVNLNDFERYIDVYCSRICQFFSGPENVRYYLYQTDDRPSTDDVFLVMEGGLLYYYLKNPYGGQAYSLLSFDKPLVYEHYSSTEANLSLRPRLTAYFDFKTLLEQKLVYRYLMAGKLAMLLNTMFPVFMEKEMFSHLCKEEPGTPEALRRLESQYEILWQSPKQVILFKSALVNYICDGTINVAGRIVSADRETRKQHLGYLLDAVKEDEGCSIAILSDDNPLLNFADCNVSLFLSDGIAFMETGSANPEYRFVRLQSMKMIDGFYAFFEHLKGMDSKSILNGREAMEFIKRGYEML